jgi:hypothetical protein
MATALTVNGTVFSYPAAGDRNWGQNASDWAAAVTTGMLQKAGGTFALTAEVDFGGTYGLKSAYFKSRTANAASAGAVRLARADVVSWRNQTSTSDLDLGVDSSNRLTFGGTVVQSAVSVTDTATIDLTLTGAALSAAIQAASIDNSMVSASAAIARSKLAGGSANRLAVNDGSGVLSDLAALTASRALATTAAGIPVAATTTAAELDYLAGVTSAVQTQLDARLLKAGGTLTGALTLSGAPTAALHPATKQYVDDTLNGVSNRKTAVRVATTTAGTLATSFENGDTIDGVVLATGDRILIKDQAAPAANGIYVVAASGAPTRATDADDWTEVVAASVFVSAGTANASTSWATNVASGGTIGVTSLTWVQTAGAASYTADGSGIELSGTAFSLELDGATLAKSASGLKIADLGIANAQISASAAIARSKVAVGTANRLVYNADTTGAMSDLGALTASRLLKTDANGLPAVISAITANRALASDASGYPVHTAVTDTELGYVSGVTSAIQTQLTAKLPLAGGTLTGALTGTDLHLSGDIDCDDIISDHIVCESMSLAGSAPVTFADIIYEDAITATVSGSATASIDITSIPAYDFYEIHMDVKLNNASGTEQIKIRFNNDSASNYAYHQTSSDSSGVLATILQQGTTCYFGKWLVKNTLADVKIVTPLGAGAVRDTGALLTTYTLSGSVTNVYTADPSSDIVVSSFPQERSVIVWKNTSAVISRMTFINDNAALFQAGSRIKIVGYNF